MRRRVTVRPQPGSVYSTSGFDTRRGPSHYRRASETDPFVFTGDIDVEIEDLESYVQVQVVNSPYERKYTYRDPSGELEVGMLVEAPAAYGAPAAHGTIIGKVVELGHGGYDGEIKDVAAVLRKADL